MLERRPDYYTQFHCLGGACPDTCCRDWSVVPDEAALADYAAAPSPLRERIAQNLVTDEDGDVCFRLDERGMCALLTPDGLCPIQRDWGEEHLCAHCAAYPRFIEEYGCLTESALAVSCPEAARLLLEAPRFTLVETDDGREDPPFPDIDPDLLSGLEHSRIKVLDLLNLDSGNFWVRLRYMLAYAQEWQVCIDSGRYSKLFISPSFSMPPLSSLPDRIIGILSLLAKLEPLRPDWPILLAERSGQFASMTGKEYAALCANYERVNPLWTRQLSNLACYLVYRHWHKTVNDNMLYGRAAFTYASCFVLYHLSLFCPGAEAALWTQFSREVEHNEDNLDELIWTLADPSCSPLTALL